MVPLDIDIDGNYGCTCHNSNKCLANCYTSDIKLDYYFDMTQFPSSEWLINNVHTTIKVIEEEKNIKGEFIFFLNFCC